MKQIKKILFPIDFAENFDTLLPWVSTFVEKFGATLYVVFVTSDLSSYSTFYVPHGNIQSFQEEAVAAAKKRMAAVVAENFKGFSKLESHVLMGSPAEKILEFAKKENIDLIVMGAHGRKGLERVLFGSVADKVATSALCPVMTIHP
ncbi:MAG: universal stress protein [Deltaproteobacteria bacterium]|nr:universal stress protein [Deltaproteobacteria bacterium]